MAWDGLVAANIQDAKLLLQGASQHLALLRVFASHHQVDDFNFVHPFKGGRHRLKLGKFKMVGR